MVQKSLFLQNQRELAQGYVHGGGVWGHRRFGLDSVSGPTWVSPVMRSVSFKSSQSTASPLVCQSLCGSFERQTLFNRHERSVVSVVMSGYR